MVVAELGGGHCRNRPLLRKASPLARILHFEQSQQNVNIAVTQFGVPRDDCKCKSIQHIDWAPMACWLGVVVDQWTLSYLVIKDVEKVLRGVRRALKPSGFFVVCLPVKLRKGSLRLKNDVGMIYRTTWKYEALFKAAGFVIYTADQKPQEYVQGTTSDGLEYGREAIWILTPSD